MRNLIMASLVLVAGCSTTRNLKMGEEADAGSRKYRITLRSEAKIGVQQKLEVGKCEDKRMTYQVMIKKESDGKSLSVVKDCTALPQSVVYWSKTVVPAGDYVLKLEVGRENRFTKGPARIFALYKDFDFDSGDDFVAEGAKELEVGKVLKGKVDSQEGNATDWIHVGGKDGAISLLLTLKDKSTDIDAQVMHVMGDKMKMLGKLLPKRKSSFNASEDGLWVRVKARNPFGQGEYTLMRGDITKGGAKAISLNVLDRFPTSEDTLAFLLEAKTLKQYDQVAVYGKKGTGNFNYLGKCTVSTVENNQARCDLKGNQNPEYVEFKASQKPSGG